MSLIAAEAFWQTQVASNTAPGAPSSVTIPTTSWVDDQLSPFGEGALAPLGLSLPNTEWPIGEGLWLRRFMTLSGQAPVLIRGNCEQALFVYFDGTYVGTLNPSNVDRTGIPAYNVVIPLQLAAAGSHALVLLAVNDGASATSYLSIEADYIPTLLPLQPESPVTETLSWLTDLIVAKDGSEQRNRIATAPRQRFEYTYPANPARKALAFNTAWGALAKTWFVPVWTQAQQLGAVAVDLLALSTIDDAEYRDASFALLWESESSWQVVSIDTFAAGTLTLSTRTRAFTDAWIMPLRTGFLAGNANRRYDGHSASLSFDFDVLDYAALTGTDAPAQFLGDDVYTEETLLTGDMNSDDLISDIDIFDPGHSLIAFYPSWTNSKVARTYNIICDGQAEAWEARKFLHQRAGRYRAFWEPSFEHDVRLLSTGTITTSMQIATDGYLEHATAKTHIAVEAGGVWYLRTISAAAQLSAGVTALTLSTSLNVAADAISRVSWLSLKRLNTDRVSIKYIGGGVAEVEFRTLEISP